MTSPTDNPQYNELDQARDELRDGIETSREMVRQTRMLIELSECDGSAANDNDHNGPSY